MNSQVVHQAHRPFVAASTPRRHVCVCRSHQHGILSVLCREQAGIGRLGEFRQQLAVATANAVLAGSLLLGSPQTAVAGEVNLAADPVYDGATILKQDARDSLSQSLRDLDRQTGFHVRVFTQYQLDRSAEKPNPRQLWGSLDSKTVVVWADPSSPNILNVPFIGDDVLAKLRRPFWTELESRFGNMFYVREQGESVALQSAMSALVECLGRDEGCKVVPGLPQEQYLATLACSIAGGLVAGFVSKIEPQGFVQRRWIWLLLFSPLWGSLFINFGLGPVVSRTSDIAPIAGNTFGFLVAAAAPALLQRLWDGESNDQGPGSVQGTRDGM